MNIIYTIVVFFYLFHCLFINWPFNKNKEGDEIIIGLSQCTMVDAWRENMVVEMRREIAFNQDYNIQLIIKDANDSNEKQINDIKELIEEGIDILIVSPNEADPLTSVVEEVYDKGIPVIIVDRKISSQKYTAFVGADNTLVGMEAAYYADKLLKGSGRILEFSGRQESSPAKERSEGFHKIIDDNPGYSTVHTIIGDWLEDKTQRLTDSLFHNFKNFDLIFAHNDFMAKAASISAKKHNIKPFIIGIDAMNGHGGGVEMVMNDVIDGTVYYPSGADKAIQIAIDIHDGKPVNKNTYLNTFLIDKNNSRTIWLQGQLIQEQQQRIDSQSGDIKNMSLLLNKRNTFLLLTSTIIVLLIIIVSAILQVLRSKIKINKILKEKNRTIRDQNKIIEKQKNDSINPMIVAEEAKETKLKLFTDLSHEFRTIVTLITAPINDLLETVNEEEERKKILLLKRSASRLARLTDAILNFRNLDENKLHLSYLSGNISDFVSNTLVMFEELAYKKNIAIYKDIDKDLYAEFDIEVVEKVIYNLLSNAIKYNKKNGSIHISLKREQAMIVIEIKDTGIGIPKNSIQYIFDRFNKINNCRSPETDSVGIGLALCKELVQLHGGDIYVESIFGEGSIFTVKIPQFHDREKNEEYLKISPKFLAADLLSLSSENKTVLIVEDNPDLLAVIGNIVSKHFMVIAATNGQEGINMALKHMPDIILSDILMPIMDGMQMCIEMKKNTKLCNIPIILITAISSHQSMLKSLEIGADAYITKPFNEDLLLGKICQLLNSRQNLKDFFCPSSSLQKYLDTNDNENNLFIKRTLTKIYDNLDKENYNMLELSSQLNMSRSTLYRKIKNITGIKPVDFVKKAKLNYAAKLILSDKGLNINEVAWRSGFNDPKYFSKCFIAEFGAYPSHYQKETEEKKNTTPTMLKTNRHNIIDIPACFL